MEEGKSRLAHFVTDITKFHREIELCMARNEDTTVSQFHEPPKKFNPLWLSEGEKQQFTHKTFADGSFIYIERISHCML